MKPHVICEECGGSISIKTTKGVTKWSCREGCTVLKVRA